MSLTPVYTPPDVEEHAEHWTARFLKSILFIITALALFGVYLALKIPIAVFPSTNFPRIVIGVDNGVMPIDQMQVTVTRPIEEVVNSVPGLDHILSLTSRGSAEIDLFFNWNVDMFQTLQYVNAATARVQTSLPSTATITTNRLTFAAFPIMGYSMTSATVPQTALWELATYSVKPQVNRLAGVSTVVIQGGQEPEFQIQPDPGKLVEAQITVPNVLDAISRSNIIDSPGLLEQNHQLVLGLVSGQVHDPAEIGGIVVKTTPSGAPIKISDIASVGRSVRPVYTVVTANGKPAVLVNVYRQPDSNTVSVADEVHQKIDDLRHALPHGIESAAFLRSIGDCERFDQERAGRDSDRVGSGGSDSGFVSAGLGNVGGGGAGDSGHDRGDVYRVAGDGAKLQFDDAGRSGGGGRAGDRRCDRGGRKYRSAP